MTRAKSPRKPSSADQVIFTPASPELTRLVKHLIIMEKKSYLKKFVFHQSTKNSVSSFKRAFTKGYAASKSSTPLVIQELGLGRSGDRYWDYYFINTNELSESEVVAKYSRIPPDPPDFSRLAKAAMNFLHMPEWCRGSTNHRDAVMKHVLDQELFSPEFVSVYQALNAEGVTDEEWQNALDVAKVHK